MRMWKPWLVVGLALVGCQKDDHDHDHEDTTEETDVAATPQAFSLSFAAVADGADVGCGDTITGLGPAGAHSAGINDVRFYVSNIVLRDADGEIVPATYDEDEFQYTGTSGWVALVDLTGNTDGACDASAISFSEGTARTHTAITGETLVDEVVSVSFDVGVPQALMKEVIASNTVEGAPSPMGEMYWSWASGYRHFVFNLTTSDGADEGEGYLHIGSVGCAGDGELALESKEACDRVNTPQVALSGFDLGASVVTVDLKELLSGLDFVAPVYDPVTFEEIGEQVGVECHSSPMQPDCPMFFSKFGLDMDSGAATASSNAVFGKR
jgi:uncharacterized repeat protein (TIGR04052 family)